MERLVGTTHRYIVLDSWRGIAALVVAIFHLQVASHLYFLPFTRNAYLLVDFFFVLSGFVISHAYAGRLGNVDEVQAFTIKRFGRLWPLHVVMLSAFVAAELFIFLISGHLGQSLPRLPFSEDRTVSAIFVNLVLLNGIGIYEGSTWNGPSWSISAEFFTYLIFAGICLFPKRAKDVILVSCIGFSLVILAFVAPKYLASSQFGLVRAILGFFVGYYVWRARSLVLPIGGTTAEILTSTMAIGFVTIAASGPIQLLTPFVFALVIFTFSKESGRLSVALAQPRLQKLGAWSYSLYMIHYFVAFAINNILRVGGKILGFPTTLPGTDLALVGNGWVMDIVTLLYLVTVIMISSWTYRYVEKPGVRLFNELPLLLQRIHRSRQCGDALRSREDTLVDEGGQ